MLVGYRRIRLVLSNRVSLMVYYFVRGVGIGNVELRIFMRILCFCMMKLMNYFVGWVRIRGDSILRIKSGII